ncbi:hypothetical protein KM031_09870 [Gemmobacter fulvus]|uniref:Uncharacterized protein n=1 Tax=Gemmobacter fulvus TaxID=2840474 RepID=A0A975S0R7_9RHOB|nr:hypothetical protein [Gemmobacter fulvus]MBT9246713.1 hypothetical protein [Gemmobacter fulvus]QWK89183.1 hypothetical protein KM031_09870 [Gemmobacter fulvus]
MKAWQIFTHSVRQVFGNFNDALRISGLIYIVQMMIAVALGGMGISPGNTLEPTVGVAFGALFASLAFLIGSLWIAVSWHRFVLQAEGQHSLVPPFHGAKIGAYFVKSLQIGLIAAIVGFALASLIGTLVLSALGQTVFAGMLVIFLTLVPVLAIVNRFSAILPGIALGEKLTLTDGWRATAGDGVTMLQLAAIVAFCSLLLGLPLEALTPGSIPSLLAEVVLGWVQVMVGVSILTTLYGHYIEKRSLV